MGWRHADACGNRDGFGLRVAGYYDDLGEPALKQAAGYGWQPGGEALVPDEKRDIRELIVRGCNLVLTTGGTGVALRDVTPEAVREIAVRELPGFGKVMRAESMKLTKNAILSRNLAAVVDRALVRNIESGDSLSGKTVDSVGISPQFVSGGRLAFVA